MYLKGSKIEVLDGMSGNETEESLNSETRTPLAGWTVLRPEQNAQTSAEETRLERENTDATKSL